MFFTRAMIAPSATNKEFFELNVGDKVMKLFRPLSPFNYPKDPQILSAIILFIIGSSIVWILDKQKEKK